MHWLARFFQKTKSEQQLDAELRFHLEKQVSDYVASGLSPEDARRRANLNFGALESVKEQSREIRRASFIETIYQDVRYALRALRKNPGFTLAAALTLALGIGANTAIFSIVNAVILRPLPYKNSSRMINLTTHTALFPTFNLGLSWLSLQKIRAQVPAIEQVSGYLTSEKTLTGDGAPTILSTVSVSDGFFDELGVTSQLGRLFTQDDFKPGQDHVVVITDTLWRARFGANPHVLGKTLILDKAPYQVVGVTSQRFSFFSQEQAWLPLAPLTADEQNPTFFMLQSIATLKRGEQIALAAAQLDAATSQMMKDYPALSKGFSISARPLLSRHVGEARDAFLMLLAAATFVLLIACANLASLLLARGSRRQREMALRSALGASPGRLLRQGLVESCLLALIGGVLGVVLAAQGIDLFRAIAPPGTPRLSEISLDFTLLWFSLLTSLAAGLVFGIVPARRASRLDPNEALKEGAGTNLGAARSASQSRLGNALVTLEVALAFVLVVGSVLMTLTLSRLLHQNPGFRTDHLLSFDLPQPPINDSQAAEALIKKQSNQLREILQKIRQVPGVAEVTASDYGVLKGMMMMQADLAVDGEIPPSSKETRHAATRYVYPDYFRTMNIPVLGGREFNERDSGESKREVIVNEAMAHQYWGTLDVLGKRLSSSTDEKGARVWNEVIGVVADSRDISLRDKPIPTYFLSMLQGGTGSMHFLVRTQTDPNALANSISRQIWAAYPDQPVTHLMTMSQNISESVGNERLRSVLLAVFAGIGFALALVGVYGVISYSVARRIQEIGIRMALGAAPRDVLRMVIGQGLVPVALGVVIGAGAALGLTRLVASQLYGVKPADPATFIGATALVLIVAVLACCIPARRAMRVDPIVALRYE
jgi:putative ABC transport system permease protein